MDPYDMSEQEFKQFLEENTTPENVFEGARNIYTFMTDLFKSDCGDSVMREWTFQWYSEKTNQKYDVIYNRWMNHPGLSRDPQ